MARRHLAKMRHSGVSIRLVPTALALDAAAKTGLFQAIPSFISNPSGASGQLQFVGSTTLSNAGGILADVIGALIFTKVFPRTPGIRFGRFRVSL